MTEVIVGTWGKSLAVRVPSDVAKKIGLLDGEPVEIEEADGDIVIRRRASREASRKAAQAAAKRIKKASKDVRLDGVTIRELIDEGRRF